MTGTIETFVDHVAGHAGVSAATALHASHAVVAGIGAYLSESARQLVADEIPAPLATALDEGDEALPIEEHVLEAGMQAGQAHEVVASVCRVLAEELSTDALERIVEAVPADVAALFAASAPATHVPHEPRRHPTIADGAPGSEHPVSEGRIPAAQASSVGDEHPHADTKLASSRGTTQERAHETLAENTEGADRTLAGDSRR
jgi:uncharacterized protein (DUF2267 family)